MNELFNVDAFEDEDSFQVFRGEALEYMKNLKESILKKWLTEIGYKEPIGYDINISNKTLEIYATRPGLLIGKAGTGVDKIKKMLSDEFRGEWHVKFTEIRGGIISINKEDLKTKDEKVIPTIDFSKKINYNGYIYTINNDGKLWSIKTKTGIDVYIDRGDKCKLSFGILQETIHSETMIPGVGKTSIEFKDGYVIAFEYNANNSITIYDSNDCKIMMDENCKLTYMGFNKNGTYSNEYVWYYDRDDNVIEVRGPIKI